MKEYDDYECARYLRCFIDPKNLKIISNQAVKVIKALGLKFDTIAFRGLSGSLIAPVVAMKMNKELIAVRKNKKDSHSRRFVEGYKKSNRYLIVDDFVASGATAKAIQTSIRKFSPKAKCIGVLEVRYLIDDNQSPLELTKCLIEDVLREDVIMKF